MTITEFESQISDEIKKNFDAEVTVQFDSIIKDNDVSLRACVIREPGVNMTPMIYLEKYLDAYNSGQASMLQIAQDISSIYKSQKPEEEFDLDFVEDFEKAKPNIVARLLNRDINRKRLEKVPYLPVMDLAVVFSYSMEMFGNNASITVTNDMLKAWNTSVKELYELAMANTKRIGIVSAPMDEFLMKMTGDESLDILFSQEEYLRCMPMVMTNKPGRYGAISMLCTDKLDELAQFFSDDLVIFPSSVHEVIVVGAAMVSGMAEANNLVMSVNAEAVLPEERLSDHAYYYSKERKLLDIILAVD